MKRDALITNERDNVATALKDLCAGDEVSFERGGTLETLKVTGNIPFGHKFALVPIPQGGDVMKYGEVIGRATAPIEVGGHVHVHNIESLRGRGDLAVGKGGGKK